MHGVPKRLDRSFIAQHQQQLASLVKTTRFPAFLLVSPTALLSPSHGDRNPPWTVRPNKRSNPPRPPFCIFICVVGHLNLSHHHNCLQTFHLLPPTASRSGSPPSSPGLMLFSHPGVPNIICPRIDVRLQREGPFIQTGVLLEYCTCALFIKRCVTAALLGARSRTWSV